MAEKGGCLKLFIGLVLGFVALIAVAGTWFYYNSGNIIRTTGATTAEYMIKGVLDELQYNEQEKARIMEPVNGFTAKMRAGEVSGTQTAAVLESFAQGPLVAFLLKSYEKRYIEQSLVDEASQAEAKKNLSRFIHGSSSGQISMEKVQELVDMIEDKEQVSPGATPLKKKLTPDELSDSITFIKDTADKAGVEDKEFEIDFRVLLEDSISKGMAVGEPVNP